MSFDTFAFWAFLLAVWGVWLAVPNSIGRKLLLIAASYFLYSTFDPTGHFVYLFLLAGFTLASYWAGRAAANPLADIGVRRASMLAGAGTCVGVLAIAKAAAAEAWIGLLPIGISFYALQAVSYIADSYRGDLDRVPGAAVNPVPTGVSTAAEGRRSRPFLDHALYMSFFPRLPAGPIVRAEQFLPQLAANPRVSSAAIWESLVLISFGLFKKLLIADNLAAAVDPVFADLPRASAARLLLAAYAYALQIYCDFSGYTDMALGTARLFGYRLPENFNWPYLALNPADFWRRWHISLSTWLRDYVYFSLPGLRSKSKAPAYFNLIVTMAICGLWHGVEWTFLIWGVYHGVLLAGYNAIRARRISLPRIPAILVMQQLAVLGWIFFRAARLSEVSAYFNGLTAHRAFNGFNQAEWTAVILIAGAFVLHLSGLRVEWTASILKSRWNPWALLLLLILAFATAALSLPQRQTFLYFRF